MIPLQAIKAKCLDCCGGSREEVKYCSVDTCPLYVFKFELNKKKQNKRELSEEQKNILRERLVKARGAKYDRTSSSKETVT